MALRQVRSSAPAQGTAEGCFEERFRREEIQASTSLWCLRRARGRSPTAQHIAPKHTGTLKPLLRTKTTRAGTARPDKSGKPEAEHRTIQHWNSEGFGHRIR
jgi:hypothetical protein